MTALTGALAFVESHSYFVLFLAFVFEGPIITAAAGVAVSLGYLSFWPILLLSAIGNIVGDLIFFVIGAIARKPFIDKLVARFGVPKEKVAMVERFIQKNPGKSMLVAKLVPAAALSGITLAGAARMRWHHFLAYSIIISFFYSLFFLLLGYYSGMALGTSYGLGLGELLLALIALLAIAIYFGGKRLRPILLKKVEEN